MAEYSLQDRILMLWYVIESGLGKSIAEQERVSAAIIGVTPEEVRSALSELSSRGLMSLPD